MQLVPKKVKTLSEKPRIPPEKMKEMQERASKRNLILREMKNHGPSTIDELTKATGMEKSNLLKHLIAMRQFGKVLIVGKRDNQLVYGLPRES
jgi:predicted transcriptional regulator